MRILLIILCVVSFALPGLAQPWATIKADGAYFYSNVKYPDYSSALAYRIDTVAVEGGDTLCRSFGQIEYEQGCYSMNGAHWTGRWIRVQPNGDTWFYNNSAQTILIKTLAGVGDSWIFYTATDKRYMRATVTGKMFETLMQDGSQLLKDTVKWIRIELMDSLGNPADDTTLNDTLVLSRNYGMVKWFTLYDYQMKYATKIKLSGVPGLGLRNITWRDIYDIRQGAEIHVCHSWHQGALVPPLVYQSFSDSSIKRLISKKVFGNYDSIQYLWQRFNIHHESSALQEFRKITIDTFSQTEFNYPGFHLPNSYMNALPGQACFGSNPSGSYSICNLFSTSKVFPVPDYMRKSGNDTCLGWLLWDGCITPQVYYRGGGGPYGSCDDGPISSITHELVYLKDSTQEWGTPFNLGDFTGIDEPRVQLFELYPNPADETVLIELAQNDVYQVRVLDPTGRQVWLSGFEGTRFSCPLGGLVSGLYFISVSAAGKSPAVRKLVLR